jgi:hypothetical protein
MNEAQKSPDRVEIRRKSVCASTSTFSADALALQKQGRLSPFRASLRKTSLILSWKICDDHQIGLLVPALEPELVLLAGPSLLAVGIMRKPVRSIKCCGERRASRFSTLFEL